MGTQQGPASLLAFPFVTFRTGSRVPCLGWWRAARAMLDALADISQRAVPGSALQHGGQRVWCAVPQAERDTATIAAARAPGRADDLEGG